MACSLSILAFHINLTTHRCLAGERPCVHVRLVSALHVPWTHHLVRHWKMYPPGRHEEEPTKPMRGEAQGGLHDPAHQAGVAYAPIERVARGAAEARRDKIDRCRLPCAVHAGDRNAGAAPPAPAAAAAVLPRLLSSVAPAALAAALVCCAGAVAHAVPFVRPPPLQGKPFASSTTPYAQSQKLQLGLDKLGKIRPCPSTNPGCVSTNPLGSSGSFASPLLIPESSAGDKAVVSLRQAIEKTQSNVDFKADEDTPYGHYIEAEVDGGVGRDVMELLVKRDAGVVAYRCMATKVTFVYPFTTAVGDSNGQKQRMAAVSQELGWYAPDIQSSMDFDDADDPP